MADRAVPRPRDGDGARRRDADDAGRADAAHPDVVLPEGAHHDRRGALDHAAWRGEVRPLTRLASVPGGWYARARKEHGPHGDRPSSEQLALAARAVVAGRARCPVRGEALRAERRDDA